MADIESEGRRTMATIRGQAAAENVMASIRAGHAAPDELGRAFAGVRDDPEACRGFSRALQKALERAGVSGRV